MQLAFRILGIAARLLLALAAVCALLGAYLAWQSLSFAHRAAQATGEVVSYREISDGGSTRFRPRVRFHTATGEIVTFDAQLATASRRFAIGDAVPINYPRANPPAARIALFTDNWLGATIAGAVALAAFVGGLFIRRAARREASS